MKDEDPGAAQDLERRHLLLGAAMAALVAEAQAQNAAAVQPRAYKVVLDNEHMRVLEYTSKPGMGVCGSGVHSHPAHLTVLLAPSHVRAKKDGKTLEKKSPLGHVFWSEAETHEVENISGRDSRALLIELKGVA